VLARGKDLTESERDRVSVQGGRLFGIAPELAEQVVRGGGTALSVGWPASWPVAGDRALVVAPYRPEAAAHETGLPAAILGSDAAWCSAALSDRVADSVERSENLSEDEFRRVIYSGDALDVRWSENLRAARWAFLADLTTAEVAASLMADEEPDLTMVCFGGLDAVTHRFLAPAMPSFFTESLPGEEIYSDVLPNYFEFIDRCIERLRRLSDDETVFIICSTYGTHPSSTAAGVSAAHTSGPPGVMIARGTDISIRPVAVPLTCLDLAPSVLATLGLSIPVEMDGRVLQEMVPAGLLSEHPLQYGGDIHVEDTAPEPGLLAAADQSVSARMAALEEEMSR
jgi:hypothetical protein